METIKREFEKSPYWRLLGLEIVEMEPGFARMVMPVTPKLLQLYGQVHGGAIASLVDSAVAAAMGCSMSPGERATTVEMKINYLAPVTEGQVYAESKIVKKGRTLTVGTTEVTDGNGRLLAIATVTYMLLK
ncbi:MAG: PaaI family thioesterase [Bacillota bacterium]